MRKIFTSVFLLLFVAGLTVLGGCGKKITFESVISEKQAYDEIVLNREEIEKETVAVVFNGQELLYEGSTNTFYYSLNKDKGSDNPGVFASINGEEAEIVVLTTDISDEIISNNESITFAVYNDTLAGEYNLICTTLPILNVDCRGLEETEEEKTSMTMTLYDNGKGVKQRVTTSVGKIGIRGASTRKYPKKSFSMTLKKENENGKLKKNEVSLLGMPEQNKWILYAAYNDGEKIRNVFSQNLWYESCATDNEKKIEAGLCYKYVEMFVNNEYYGLYALGYQMNDDLMETGDNATLYKKAEWDAENYISMFQNYFPGYKLWDDDDLQDSEKVDYSYWDRILSMYYYLEDEKTDSSKLRACIDENNAIDFYLFLNLVQGFDNVLDSDIKNMFLYISDEEEGNYQLYIPWDLDLTWGNEFIDDESVNSCAQYGVDVTENAVWETGYLNQLLVNGDTDIDQKITDKYRSLRMKKWSDENINKMLDEYESDIYGSGAILREKTKWPDGSYNQAADGLETFREYVLNRFSEMDNYISRLENLNSDNFYIRRTVKYNDFDEKTYLIYISDRKLLLDEDFLDLLEIMGIDAEYITENVNLVLGNRLLGYEYLNYTDMDPYTIDTDFGILENIRLPESEDVKYYTDISFSVRLNGKTLYDTYQGENGSRMFIFDDSCAGSFMTFDKDYEMTINITTFEDFSLYVKALKYADGISYIVINNRELLEDEKINSLLQTYAAGEKFNISYSDSGANTIQIYTQNGSYDVDNVLFTFDLFNEEGKTSVTQKRCDR